MKVIAINGSPKKHGNTYHALNMVGESLKAEGIEFEIVQVGNKSIRGCMGCGGCVKSRDEKCVFKDDPVNETIQKMKEADGILLGSPVHYAGVAGTMKSFLDRAFYVAGVNGGLFRNKVGASVVAVRRTGGMPAFEQLNNFLNYSEMIMPTSNYWNVIHGTMPGEVLEDKEGCQIMEVLGKNMAYLLKLKSSSNIEQPTKVKKEWTHFIR